MCVYTYRAYLRAYTSVFFFFYFHKYALKKEMSSDQWCSIPTPKHPVRLSDRYMYIDTILYSSTICIVCRRYFVFRAGIRQISVDTPWRVPNVSNYAVIDFFTITRLSIGSKRRRVSVYIRTLRQSNSPSLKDGIFTFQSFYKSRGGTFPDKNNDRTQNQWRDRIPAARNQNRPTQKFEIVTAETRRRRRRRHDLYASKHRFACSERIYTARA